MLTALSVVSGLPAGPAAAQTNESPASPEQELADRYAPVVMLKEQSGPCDEEGEAFAPMSVDVVLDNDDVTLRQAGTGDPVVTRGPAAADLFGRGDGFFLDFNGLALDPGCVYEQNFDVYTEGRDSVVYAHIVQQDDQPGRLALQFWLYWYYNDWNNTHESDWEFIQIEFAASTVEEALASEPISVGYAQHEGGERAAWDDGKLERDGSHPVVYSSAGSHASYFESTVFLGRRGTEGVGCDTTIGPSVATRPLAVVLPNSVAAATDEFAWLDFNGRWGERQSGPFNGPTGPNTKEQWTAPFDWHDQLRDGSVTIPAGDEANDTVLSTFCDVVAFGSNQLRSVQQSPTQPIIVFGAAALLIRWFAGRTIWTHVPAVPLRQRRRTGQMIRGAVTSYWTSRGGVLAVAVLYVPAAIVVGIVGRYGSFIAGQSVAGVLTPVMYVTAAATIAAFWHLESSGDRNKVGVRDLLTMRLIPVVKTLAEALVIVGGLGLTVVGLPWAIRQLIRYQFIIPITVTEGLSGRAALRRSTELVSGRWWRTAITVVLFGALALAVNSTIQLTLLFVLSSLPLWFFLVIAFLAAGLVAPLLATPALLLYGDAASEAADNDANALDDEIDLVTTGAEPN